MGEEGPHERKAKKTDTGRLRDGDVAHRFKEDPGGTHRNKGVGLRALSDGDGSGVPEDLPEFIPRVALFVLIDGDREGVVLRGDVELSIPAGHVGGEGPRGVDRIEPRPASDDACGDIAVPQIGSRGNGQIVGIEGRVVIENVGIRLKKTVAPENTVAAGHPKGARRGALTGRGGVSAEGESRVESDHTIVRAIHIDFHDKGGVEGGGGGHGREDGAAPHQRRAIRWERTKHDLDRVRNETERYDINAYLDKAFPLFQGLAWVNP
jgi:hypothetical protein